MSSRNRYLSTRAAARARCVLWQSAASGHKISTHSIAKVSQRGTSYGSDGKCHARGAATAKGPIAVDYARVVDRATLEARPWKMNDEVIGSVVALIAAHVGTTRLIDNLLLEPQLAKHPVLHSS